MSTASRLAAFILFMTLCSCVSYQPKATSAPAHEPVIWTIGFVDNGLPVVDVRIGNGMYQMAIDLGLCRQVMSIKSDVLSRVSSGTTGHSVLATDAMKGSLVKLDYQRIEQVSIGDMVLRDVEAMPETREAVPEAVDGLIGLGLLGRHTVLIDYKGERVALYSPEYEPVDMGSWHKVKVRATIAEGFIVEVQAAGRSYNMLLDTGSWNKDNESAIFMKKHRLAELDRNVELFIDTLSIGRYDLEPLFDMPVPFDGVLGWAFFSRYKVLLKLDEQLLYYIEP